MRRRSGRSREPVKARRRKAVTRKRAAPKAVRRRGSSPASQEAKIARLTRELSEALEAIVVDQSGLSIFDLLRYCQHDHAATLCAFDLLELDGADVRSRPIEERKQHLAWVLRQTHPGIAINATYAGDGAEVNEHACALGCEGIVSKRLGSPYRAGRTDRRNRFIAGISGR